MNIPEVTVYDIWVALDQLALDRGASFIVNGNDAVRVDGKNLDYDLIADLWLTDPTVRFLALPDGEVADPAAAVAAWFFTTPGPWWVSVKWTEVAG